jgi:hypothetical protein
MRRFVTLTAALMLASMAAGTIAPAHSQSANDPYRIMPMPSPLVQPQPTTPWIPPPLKSDPSLTNTRLPPPPTTVPSLRSMNAPPPIYVPDTGQSLPNEPTISGSGPGGKETYQDRAVRCADQAGNYGALAGDRSTYIGMCINQ